MLNMAVFAAVLAYTLQAISFVLLRRNLPNIERPYVQPVGAWRARTIAGVIALVALVSIFLNEDYRPGVYGVAVYFAARHRLLRDRGAASPGALARGGVRAHEG